MRCNERRQSKELEAGVASNGEPASGFPCNPPIPNQARVAMTLSLAGMGLFAYIRCFRDIESIHSGLLVIHIF
jgi:hypothetical protein